MADDPIIELDVNDFADEVEQVEDLPTAEESSPEETKEVAEESEETPEESEEEAEVEEEPEAEAEEQPLSAADKRKEQLNGEIRDLLSQRNSIRQEVEQLNAKAYTSPSAQELVDQGYTEADARLAALEQRQELSEFNSRVTELNTVLQTEAQRALQDFPEFNPESPTYNEPLAKQVATLYQQAAGLQTDPNTGLVISANVTPYTFYKTFADAIQTTAIENQVKGQKANEKMLSAVDAPSSAVPKETKEDPFLVGLLGK